VQPAEEVRHRLSKEYILGIVEVVQQVDLEALVLV
jgi:hypothetical protein